MNGSDRAQDVAVRFKMSGKDVQLWNPATGEMSQAGYAISGGHTTVPLHLGERETVFVVFQGDAKDSVRGAVASGASQLLAAVEGPWEVRFAPQMGAPEKVQIERLASWTASADSGIKYYSGAATYQKVVEADKRWFGTGKRIVLDLGRVGDVAEVEVNGKALEVLWKAPYEVDVTEVLKPGKNQLDIRVINQWTNRLIGDKLAGPEKKVLAAYVTPFGGQYQLGAAGLLGPVRIVGKE